MIWDILVKKGDPQDSWVVDENFISPDSWVENGKRHAIIYGGDLMADKLILQKFQGHWFVVEETIPF